MISDQRVESLLDEMIGLDRSVCLSRESFRSMEEHANRRRREIVVALIKAGIDVKEEGEGYRWSRNG